MQHSTLPQKPGSQTSFPSTILTNLLWSFLVSFLIVNVGLIVAESARSEVIGNPWVDADFTSHLGGEYDFIAIAIRHGRGFSDPFGRETGATGWMPPLVPYCLSGLYLLVADNREIVVIMVQFIQATSLLFCLTAVLYPFRKHPQRWIFVVITSLSVAVHFYYLFQFTHDHVVLMVLCTLVWLQFSYLKIKKLRTFKEIGLGVFGGMAALASPVLGFVWSVLTVIENRTRAKSIFLMGGVSLAVVAPWVVVNSIRIGMFCPIKSNAAYELWQAQVADDDGIVDTKLSRVHPYHQGNPDAKQYSDLGEAEFLKLKKQEWQVAMRNHPLDYFERTANRMIAAFVWTVPYRDSELVRSWRLNMKRCWTLLVTASVIFLLVRLPSPMNPLVRSALVVGLLYLTPYLLVSYYERYDTAVFPLRLFLF